MSFSNVPYWSLCYEMWYYILFAIVTFTRGNVRIWLAAMSMLLLGPKILLLAPIWILGVAIHRYQPLYRLPQWQGWLLFLCSWPLYAIYQHYDVTEYGSQLLRQLIGEKWHHDLIFSKFFIADYPLALIIAANFIGFRVIAHHFSPVLLPFEKIIRWLSGYTFSLYIFHQPLLQFYAAVFNGDPAGKLFYAEVMIATLLSIGVIGSFTEKKRGHLRNVIRRMLIAIRESKWWPGRIETPLVQERAGSWDE
jgi:peptidoglycan/LPS O-acetylase OafA/YrhL